MNITPEDNIEFITKQVRKITQTWVEGFKQVREERKLLRELLGKIHCVDKERFSEKAITAAYIQLCKIKPKMIKIREGDTRKGGDEV